MQIFVSLNGPDNGMQNAPGAPGTTFFGRHVIVSSEGICLDGVWIVERDRRMKTNRIDGHPWISADRQTTFASFRVDADPRV